MWKAYPRHSVNLSPGCYATLLETLVRGEVLEGPHVPDFESAFARYVGTRYAVGVSSGRAALYLALQALGFDPGDEIIMPAYTFHIVPLVIDACGLKPVFVDVREGTYNIDVSQIEACITPRTRAILATHMYGQPCDMEFIGEIAATNDLMVLEDCAHALGARYGVRMVGSLGDLGLFTFAMAKNMPCFGGGMLTTSDRRIYENLMRIIRPPSSGRLKGVFKEVSVTTANYVATLSWVFSLGIYPLMRLLAMTGSNAFDPQPGQESVSVAEVKGQYPTRITNLQAAVGRFQLRRIDDFNARLNDNARRYNQLLADTPAVMLPSLAPGRSHTFLYYRIRVKNRQALRRALMAMRVDTRDDDMSDCTRLAPFCRDAHPLPVTSRLPAELLEIPNNPRLKWVDVDTIAGCIKKAVRQQAEEVS